MRSRLGFNQYGITVPKEVSVLIMNNGCIEGENMQTQYNVLSYKIDLYFLDYKLAIEVKEGLIKIGLIDHEIKKQKTSEKELSCEFIRINPDKNFFNIFKAINEIYRHIKKPTKESLIDGLSKILLRLDTIKTIQ